MQNLDIGKLVTIIMIFFIAAYFFGDKAVSYYDHKDDMQFSLSKIVYTQKAFNEIPITEQQSLIKEISLICIQKHAVDKISCDDTAYWLAHGLEAEGIDVDLAIEWMKPCQSACETKKYNPALYSNVNEQTQKNAKKTKAEGTHWIWEED